MHSGGLFQLYSCGDQQKDYPPFRELEPTDMPTTNLRKRLSDFKGLYKRIEDAARAVNKWKSKLSTYEANTLFTEYFDTIQVNSRTKNARTRRASQLKWSSISKYAVKRQKQDQIA